LCGYSCKQLLEINSTIVGFNSNGYLKYDVSKTEKTKYADLYVRVPAPPSPNIPPFNVVPAPASWSIFTVLIGLLMIATGAGSTSLTVGDTGFFFNVTGVRSGILERAFERYYNIIFGPIQTDLLKRRAPLEPQVHISDTI
jgi:hypothetical protein